MDVNVHGVILLIAFDDGRKKGPVDLLLMYLVPGIFAPRTQCPCRENFLQHFEEIRFGFDCCLRNDVITGKSNCINPAEITQNPPQPP